MHWLQNNYCVREKKTAWENSASLILQIKTQISVRAGSLLVGGIQKTNKPTRSPRSTLVKLVCSSSKAGWAHQTYRFQDPCGIFMQPCRVDHFIVQYGFKEVIFVLCFKGRVATEHLVEQHAHCPPIHCGPVEHLLEDLCIGVMWEELRASDEQIHH